MQIQHYVEEHRKWAELQDYIPEAEELRIVLQNPHDLESKPKESLLKLLDPPPADGDFESYSGPRNFQCLLCRKLGAYGEGVTQDEIIEHVADW